MSAQLAQDCLDTVPVVTDDATRLIDGIAPFLQFQSTLAYLKNPPKTYQLPAVDILGALDKIRQNVTNGVYKSEHSLQTDIFDLLLSAHDGHLNWQGDLIGAAFVFRYPWKLVSVSEDGKKTPLVYTACMSTFTIHTLKARLTIADDILANSTDLQVISSTFQAASPVVEINGRPVVSFLKDLSLRQSWMLDPDGLYNSLFWSKAQNGTGAFMKPDLAQSPGDISTLKFANGSIHTYSNIAVTGNFTGIVDGESLYAQYCTGRPFQLPSTIPEELQKRQVSNSSQSPQAPPGYPDPVQIQSKFKVGGYYLQGHGLDTTAVLSVPSFDPGDTQGLDLEFQRTIQNFLAQAKADGKTKLIVDLQANTGGTVALGFDTFLQLFPNLEAVILNNWRAHTGFDVIGRGMNERLVNAASASTADFESIRQAGGTASFATINAKNENGSSITSWDQLYNPTTVNNDNFTALHQWALNSTFWTNPLQITTFGDRTNWTTPPFKAEDVIMITDGFCGSTCSVFAELMRTQAKIKSYTFGGRPDNTGPMQAVGGVRGGNVLTWVELATFVGLATNFTTKDPFPDDATKIPPDVETQINDVRSFLLTSLLPPNSIPTTADMISPHSSSTPNTPPPPSRTSPSTASNAVPEPASTSSTPSALTTPPVPLPSSSTTPRIVVYGIPPL